MTMTMTMTMTVTEPPYKSYAAIMGVFLGGLATAGALARLLDREPACQTPLDYAILSMASFKAARTLTSDHVTSFIRQPFVEGDAYEGKGEEPVHDGGMQQAIGELVTCSRCMGTWLAGGLVWAQVLAPRFGRLLTWSLATAGANDFLQAGFAALTAEANKLEEEAPA